MLKYVIDYLALINFIFYIYTVQYYILYIFLVLCGFYIIYINHVEICLYRYKITFGRLKGLKTEIEHLQLLREKSRVKLQRDFEYWWTQEAMSLQVLLLLKFNCLCLTLLILLH